MTPTGHTSAIQSFSSWLDQRRPWQYALIMASVTTASGTATLIIIESLLHGHLNPSAIVGTGAGLMIGTFTAALGVRLTRPGHHH